MSTCGSDFDKLGELTKKLAELNATYEHLIERWTILEELMEV